MTATSRFGTWLGVGVLAILAAAALNFALAGLPWKFDLTEDGRYTLPPPAARIAAGLEDLVLVTVYLSEDLPTPIRFIPRALQGRLEEFRTASGGRLRYEFIDPGKDEELKKELARRTPPIVPVQAADSDQGKMVAGEYFLWLVFRYGKEEVAYHLVEMQAAIRSEGEFLRQLPFQVAAKLVKLRNPEVKIGIASEKKPPPPELQQEVGRDPFDGLTALREAIKRHLPAPEDVSLKSGMPLREDLGTIVVHRPEALDERAVFELDQYLMKGRNVVLLLDNFAATDIDRIRDLLKVRESRDGTLAVRPVEHGLGPWLAHFGIQVEDGYVEDSSCGNQVMASMELMADAQGRPVLAQKTYRAALPGVVLVNEVGPDRRPTGQFSDSSPAFAGLNVVGFAWPVPLRVDREALAAHGSRVELQEILHTTPDARVRRLEGTTLHFREGAAGAGPEGERGRRPLVVGLSGMFRSYFAGRSFGSSDRPPRKGPDGADLPELGEPPPRLDESRAPGQLWVVADSDFASILTSNVLLRNMQSLDSINGVQRMQAGLVNLLDTVLLGTDLVEVRRPHLKDRLVSETRIEDDRGTIRFWTVIAPVLALFAFGILAWVLRAILTRVPSPGPEPQAAAPAPAEAAP
jgi:hypothetical protein